MDQKINVSLEISVPSDMILIKKSEFEDLDGQDDYGKWVNMAEFVVRSTRSAPWIRKHVLENVLIMDGLRVENGGWVHYPNNRGDHYSFRLSGMKDFLENDFHRFIGGAK